MSNPLSEPSTSLSFDQHSLEQTGLGSGSRLAPCIQQTDSDRTSLEELTVEISDGELDVNLAIKKDTVDKFGELFQDLSEGSDSDASSTQTEFSFGSASEE